MKIIILLKQEVEKLILRKKQNLKKFQIDLP